MGTNMKPLDETLQGLGVGKMRDATAVTLVATHAYMVAMKRYARPTAKDERQEASLAAMGAMMPYLRSQYAEQKMRLDRLLAEQRQKRSAVKGAKPAATAKKRQPAKLGAYPFVPYKASSTASAKPNPVLSSRRWTSADDAAAKRRGLFK